MAVPGGRQWGHGEPGRDPLELFHRGLAGYGDVRCGLVIQERAPGSERAGPPGLQEDAPGDGRGGREWPVPQRPARCAPSWPRCPASRRDSAILRGRPPRRAATPACRFAWPRTCKLIPRLGESTPFGYSAAVKAFIALAARPGLPLRYIHRFGAYQAGPVTCLHSRGPRLRSPASQPRAQPAPGRTACPGRGCPASSPDLAPLSRSQPLPRLPGADNPPPEAKSRPPRVLGTPLAGSAGAPAAAGRRAGHLMSAYRPERAAHSCPDGRGGPGLPDL